MTAIKETFTEKILNIEGVKGFVLARDDGAVLAQRIPSMKPASIAAMMVLCGLKCHSLKKTMGFSHLHYWMLSLKNNETLLIFPIRNYFLGILSNKDGFNAKLAFHIRRFIDTLQPHSEARVDD